VLLINKGGSEFIRTPEAKWQKLAFNKYSRTENRRSLLSTDCCKNALTSLDFSGSDTYLSTFLEDFNGFVEFIGGGRVVGHFQ